MTKQHVRYVLCDRNHPDLSVIDGGPLHACGMLHPTLRAALRAERSYLKAHPGSFIAKVTYERVGEGTKPPNWQTREVRTESSAPLFTVSPVLVRAVQQVACTTRLTLEALHQACLTLEALDVNRCTPDQFEAAYMDFHACATTLVGPGLEALQGVVAPAYTERSLSDEQQERSGIMIAAVYARKSTEQTESVKRRSPSPDKSSTRKRTLEEGLDGATASTFTLMTESRGRIREAARLRAPHSLTQTEGLHSRS